MKRVLHIVSSMNCGGIETFIMNIYRNIDRSKIQFDFVVNTKKEGFYDKEIKELGGIIYQVCEKKDSVIKNFLQVKKIIKDNRYNIVHRHGSNAMMVTDLAAAKYGGAKICIAHSHNIQASGFKPAHKCFKKILPYMTTHRFACSEEAGRYLFNQLDYRVIHNVIDSNRFKFSKLVRAEVRKELDINEESLVIGNIARFHPQKNHSFLIDIFYEMYTINPKAVLLLIGEGNLLQEIKEKVKSLGIENAVKFLGVREDVQRILQGVDVFLFPSIYEGLGIVLIEAQAAGLPCITSDKVVPYQVKITDLVKFIPLENNAKDWAKETLLFYDEVGERMDTSEEIIRAGYDMKSNILELEEFYDEF